MVTRWYSVLSSSLLAGAVLVACGDDGLGPESSGNRGGASSSSRVCDPGATQTCVGAGVCQGVQVCLADGSAWAECQCGATGAGGTTAVTGSGGATANTGGSSVATGGISPTGGVTAQTGGTRTSGGTTALTGGTRASGGTTTLTGGTRASGGTTALTGGTSSSTGGTVQYIPIVQGYSTDTGHGIAGPWYTFHDPLGTSISPECGAGMGGTCFDNVDGTQVCTTGTASMVPCDVYDVCDYDNYWGGGIGFNFNQAAGENTVKGSWDGSAYQGVAFRVENSYSTTIRVYLKVIGDDTLNYCMDVSSTGNYVIGWQQFRLNCWDSASTTTVPASYLSQIDGLAWQIATSEISSITFGFCVGNLRIF